MNTNVFSFCVIESCFHCFPCVQFEDEYNLSTADFCMEKKENENVHAKIDTYLFC